MSIKEASDGSVLLCCHAGCSAADVVRAIGLELRDLYPKSDSWRDRQAEISAERQRFLKNPQKTVRDALSRELERLRQQIVDECGYARPLRSAEINVARSRVSKIFDVTLAAIAPLPWEFPPHDSDPLWPVLFEHSLRNVMIAKWSDPDRPPGRSELFIAAMRAARELHSIARAATP